MLPVTSGQCGLRQNEAVFLHNKNLKRLFDGIPQSGFDYIAASVCPSERLDSYMPCFVVGSAFATTLSKLLGIPLFTCSHQKNHIGAALYSGNCTELLNDEFFAYHVSGGTTDILLCRPTTERLNIRRIGGTADISCGQLIDRAGTAMKLDFPCGKSIEKYSTGNLSGKVKLSRKEFNYNFSGYQNKIQDMLCCGAEMVQVCDYTLDVVYTFICDSIKYIRDMYKELPVILSGGVMSNKHISQLVKNNFSNVYFAQHEFSVDNAVGTAFMCAYERGLLNV